MIIKATCKFCHKPLEVECDDRYLELGDPYKLIPLLACNDCGDARILRREKTETLVRLCGEIACMDEETRRSDTVRNRVTQAAQAYCRMIASWHHAAGMVWDDAIVDALVADPGKLSTILGRCWRMFRDQQASPELI